MLVLALAPALFAGDAADSEPLAPPLVDATAAEVLEHARGLGAKAVLINAWATWCQPCVEEMPDLLRLRRDLRERGFELVLVSADFEDAKKAARRFLGEQGVDFKTFRKDEADQSFIDTFDTSWSGALPGSFVYDDRGRRVFSFEGKVSYEQIEEVVLPLLEGSSERTSIEEDPA